jgi:hypothetical protein
VKPAMHRNHCPESVGILSQPQTWGYEADLLPVETGIRGWQRIKGHIIVA